MKMNWLMTVAMLCGAEAMAQDTGMTRDERTKFYHLDEGSEVIPLELLKPLHSAVTKAPFLKNMERFGLVADPGGGLLPIGITAAPSRDTRVFADFNMVGVNCAACHVNYITYQGQQFPIDGAPSRFDIEGFYGELADSVTATIKNPNELTGYLWRLATGSDRQILSPKGGKLLSKAFGADGTKDDSALATALARIAQEEVAADDSIPEGQEAEAFYRSFKRAPDAARGEEAPPPKGEFHILLNNSLGKLKGANVTKLKDLSVSADVEEKLNWLPSTEKLDALVSTTNDIRTALKLLKARVAFLRQLASANVGGTPGQNGRTDAFGHARNFIFKEKVPTTAPVDYPHLWGFGDVTWLHWNANTNSVLERNIGQALGLGAVFAPDMSSTVSLTNIHVLEDLARKIRAPKWPEEFGKPDEVKVKAGELLFKAKCASCHVDVEPATHDFPLSDLAEVMTDPNCAKSFAARLSDNREFSQALAEKLTALKLKAASDENVPKDELAKWEMGRNPALWRTLVKYRARPLRSIWATAPYLHNGSVPTIDALLSKDRPAKFRIGQREYDPETLGYSEKVKDVGTKVFDCSVSGNSNAGHPWGTESTPEERKQLIEYLKTR